MKLYGKLLGTIIAVLWPSKFSISNFHFTDSFFPFSFVDLILIRRGSDSMIELKREFFAGIRIM